MSPHFNTFLKPFTNFTPDSLEVVQKNMKSLPIRKCKIAICILTITSVLTSIITINLLPTFAPQIQRGHSIEHEATRRRIMTEIRDLWYYTSTEMRRFTNTTNDNNVIERSKRILEEIDQRSRSLTLHLRHVSSADYLQKWRIQEAQDLQVTVQDRLHYLQNPENCSTAKKLICEPCFNCGFSSRLAHLVLCFSVAYNTQRTLMLPQSLPQIWKDIFQPISDTCVNYINRTYPSWPGDEDKPVLTLYQQSSSPVTRDYFPLSIPEDLSDRLIRLHGHPGVWWIGQMYRYLLRPLPSWEKILNQRASDINFKSPIVGVHVRRTDIIRKAPYHGLEDYMVYVEDHFRLLEIGTASIQRRVYLATEEPTLYNEAKSKFPQYIFLGDPRMSSLASDKTTRYTDLAFQGFLVDVHFLSHCDFIVCTFSSGVCRLAYAMMQTHHPDTSANYQSLDDIFHFNGQTEHLQRAIVPHASRDSSEIDLQVGDFIQISGNLWNGSSDGTNKRSGKTGHYPSYKVEEIVNVAKMPVRPPRLR